MSLKRPASVKDIRREVKRGSKKFVNKLIRRSNWRERLRAAYHILFKKEID